MPDFVAMLTAVRDGAVAALAAAGRPAADVAYVSEGEVAYDCCDRLIVGIDSVTALGDARCGMFEVGVSVHLLRCAAPWQGNNAPAPADVEAVGLGLAADVAALWSLAGFCPLDIQPTGATFPRSQGGECAPAVVTYLVGP